MQQILTQNFASAILYKNTKGHFGKMQNQVVISGEIISINYSHKEQDENYYLAQLDVGPYESIPVILNSKNVSVNYIGQQVKVDGHLITYHSNSRYNYVCADEISFCDKKINEVKVDGFICKIPTYRKTPLGKQISDVLLAVDVIHYVPCILYGKDAKQVSKTGAGEHVHIQGKLQCREYIKDEAAYKVVEIVSNKLSFE